MRKSIAVLVILSMALSACGWRDSRINPVNWFGNSRSAPVPAQDPGQTNPLIPDRSSSIFKRRNQEAPYLGSPVDQITALSVEPSGGGAIIRVTGRTLRQGAYDVRLVAANDGTPVDGLLTLELRAMQPDDTPQGPEATRRVHAGRFVSDQDLSRISAIRVVGLRSSQTSSR